MLGKIALKRLTASDLGFFEWHYRNKNAGNQKSINLNKDVFELQLFPAAPAVAAGQDDKIPIALTLFGPGHKGPHAIARKIIKGGSYKNWRLNGEFVRNPDEDPTRYNVLQAGDLALLNFRGEGVPTAADVVFIAARLEEDAALHSELARLIEPGRQSMIKLDQGALEAALKRANVSSEHPAAPLASDPAFDLTLQDAAYGDATANREVQRRAARPVSAAELADARRNAERIGRDGEGLVSFFLEQQQAMGAITSIDWTSQQNATAPYDFLIVTVEGHGRRIEVKSTTGEFARPMHISAAEVAVAAVSEEPYDLYRVFAMDDEGGRLRIARDVREFAQRITSGLKLLPPGVRSDGFSIDPSVLDWEAEHQIERPDAAED